MSGLDYGHLFDEVHLDLMRDDPNIVRSLVELCSRLGVHIVVSREDCHCSENLLRPGTLHRSFGRVRWNTTRRCWSVVVNHDAREEEMAAALDFVLKFASRFGQAPPEAVFRSWNTKPGLNGDWYFVVYMARTVDGRAWASSQIWEELQVPPVLAIESLAS